MNVMEIMENVIWFLVVRIISLEGTVRFAQILFPVINKNLVVTLAVSKVNFYIHPNLDLVNKG